MMYTQNKFRIVSKKAIGRDIYSFEIHCPVVAQAAMPGQFVHIRANGFTLRRPISIAGIGETTLRIVFEIRGEGTAEIARLNEGDQIDMLAPLGHGFTLMPERSFSSAAVSVLRPCSRLLSITAEGQR